MFVARSHRIEVEAWLKEQSELPSRKSLKAQFPEVPQKILRKALQKSRDLRESES